MWWTPKAGVTSSNLVGRAKYDRAPLWGPCRICHVRRHDEIFVRQDPSAFWTPQAPRRGENRFGAIRVNPVGRAKQQSLLWGLFVLLPANSDFRFEPRSEATTSEAAKPLANPLGRATKTTTYRSEIDAVAELSTK